MKFILDDASLLWQACNRVMRATPRKMMGTELDAMCLEANGDGTFYVHRYSAEAYAEQSIGGVTIIESGKVLVADCTIAKTARGRVSFELSDNDLVGTEVAHPSNVTTMRLSLVDPFLYTRTYPDPDSKPINLSLDLSREVMWMTRDSKELYDWVCFDGHDIVTTNKINITVMKNDSPVSDDVIFLPGSFFLAYRPTAQVIVDGRKVWVRDGDFLYSNTTLDLPYRIKGYFWSIIASFLDMPKQEVRVKKDEFAATLRDIFEVSSDRIYRDGLCQLAYNGSELVIKSLGSDQGGQAQRVIEAIRRDENSTFTINNYPRMMIEAVNTIDDGVDEVTLSVCWSEIHQGHALILHSDKVFNFIPCSKG